MHFTRALRQRAAWRKRRELAVKHRDQLHLRGVLQVELSDGLPEVNGAPGGDLVVDGARDARDKRQDHLHRFHVGVGLACGHLSTIGHEVLDQLARGRGHQARGVQVVGEEAGRTVDHDALPNLGEVLVHLVRLAVDQHEEATVGERHHVRLGERAVAPHRKRVR